MLSSFSVWLTRGLRNEERLARRKTDIRWMKYSVARSNRFYNSNNDIRWPEVTT